LSGIYERKKLVPGTGVLKQPPKVIRKKWNFRGLPKQEAAGAQAGEKRAFGRVFLQTPQSPGRVYPVLFQKLKFWKGFT
jgi:hypothetical protein